MQTIHALLQELGKLINIPGLALDDDQTCTLDIDGQPIALRWLEESDTLLAYGVLMRDAPESVPLLRFLLKANLFGAASKGLHIGLHAPSNAFVMSGTVAVSSLDAESLGTYLGFMADSVALWKAKISELGRQAAPGGAPEEGVADPALLRC